MGETARVALSIPADSSSDSDSGSSACVIARLYSTTSTHHSIRHNVLENVELVQVSLPALGIQNLMNGRGPDAFVSSIPNERVHSERLMDMLLACHQKQCCLVSKTRDNVDIVLVPRVPTVASRDSVCFLVYATNLCAVNLCESLRLEKRVAVVLDLDQTLVDAEPCAWDGDVAGLDAYDGVRWEDVEVRAGDGRVVRAKRGWPVNGEGGVDGRDVSGEGHAFYIHYSRYLFRVRVRRGWWELRRFLIDNNERYMPFVCSKGKREYVELIYGGLDVDERLIQREQWQERITSTWPDELVLAADKTALMALGCAGPGDGMAAETHVAAPVICVVRRCGSMSLSLVASSSCCPNSRRTYPPSLPIAINPSSPSTQDDCPQTYAQLFRPNVLLVEKFNGMSAGGFAMLRVVEDLNTFWEGVCGKEGTFAWRAAQSFGMAIMDAVRRTAMEGADSLALTHVRCRKQGQLLYRQLTVEYLLPGSTPASLSITRGRRQHAPMSAGALERPRSSLDLNNRGGLSDAVLSALGPRRSLDVNDAVLSALGPRRSLDETTMLSPGSRRMMASSESIAIPKMPRNESGTKNNFFGSASTSLSSPQGLSPGSIDDDDLVTYSLRFKN